MKPSIYRRPIRYVPWLERNIDFSKILWVSDAKWDRFHQPSSVTFSIQFEFQDKPEFHYVYLTGHERMYLGKEDIRKKADTDGLQDYTNYDYIHLVLTIEGAWIPEVAVKNFDRLAGVARVQAQIDELVNTWMEIMSE